MLIAGNCVLAGVLLGLQKLFPLAQDRLVVLMITNALVGASIAALKFRAVYEVFKRNLIGVSVWVPAACFAYAALLVYPAQLPLGLFTIASALAPPIAALIFGRVEGRSDRSFTVSALVPLFLLGILAIMEGQFATGANVVALFLFVLSCHTAAQFGLRSTAQEKDPPLVSAVVSLLAALLLFAIITARAPTLLVVSGRQFLAAMAFAPGILLLQFLHLSGLRNSTLAGGALGMNTAVPIAILSEELYAREFRLPSLIVSGLYVLVILGRGLFANSQVPT